MTVHNNNLNKKNILQPLRIPMKWTISYNVFCESDNPVYHILVIFTIKSSILLIDCC